eukprot:CAMPEP_0185265292 /NCGR_PEP_ID=MMETSP1359-20130426/27043_1 /TAXON_ID=552665 /ORGANISM="Bigelowiella longifila, Strain CCMP242" /LENGTH=179 /DNA_ID=CAMNT_0027854483 /DNA_START=62 /DNA_END=601 /DNA_ORIENTATION=+
MPEISLIAGKIGPFQPQQPVMVPLWLALQLRKEGKCGIMPPEWMDLDNLQAKENEEREQEENFTELPYHYEEIASLLLKTAQSDMKDSRKVKTILKNISDLRSSKIKQGLRTIKGKIDFIKLNNVAAMELYSMRGFSVKTLSAFKAIAHATNYEPSQQMATYEASQSQSQTQASSQYDD